MKKLFIIFAVLLFAAPLMAQTWHTANQVTVAWDAVAKVQPTDGANKYQVYIKFQNAAAAPVAVGNEIEALQQTVSFSTEGRYYLCVEAVRYPAGETQPLRSDLSCSHDAAVCAGGTPFGVKYFVNPGKPGGLRMVP
jgi:hypothetical protein